MRRLGLLVLTLMLAGCGNGYDPARDHQDQQSYCALLVGYVRDMEQVPWDEGATALITSPEESKLNVDAEKLRAAAEVLDKRQVDYSDTHIYDSTKALTWQKSQAGFETAWAYCGTAGIDLGSPPQWVLAGQWPLTQP